MGVSRKGGVSMRIATVSLGILLACNAMAVPGFAQSSQVFRAADRFPVTGMAGDEAFLALADVSSLDTGSPDGNLDIVVAAANQRIAVLAGDGTGYFESLAQTSIGRIPAAIAVGNLDADQIPDVIIADSGNNIVVYRGFPEGPPYEQVGNPIAVGRDPVAIVLADLNKDGILDALVASEGPQSVGVVTILRGVGDGTFTAPPFPASATVGGGSATAAIVVRDFNKDQILDFAIANALSSDVWIFLGDADGRYSETDKIYVGPSVSVKGEPIGIDSGDFDGNGTLDLVVVNGSLDQVAVIDGLAGGAFSPSVHFYDSGASGSSPTGVAVADLNGDSHPDVTVPNNRSSDVSVLLAQANGTLRAPRAFMADQETLAAAIGNVNNDGIPDVVAIAKGVDGPTAAILLGDGAGALASVENVPSKPTPLDVASADFDDDGLTDLALIYSSGEVEVFRSTGSDGFEPMPGSPFAVGGDPVAVTARDMNRDGTMDLLIANKTSGKLTILPRAKAGGFGAPVLVNASAGLSAVTAADFNRDGFEDVALGQQASGDGDGSVLILLGRANGTFSAPTAFTVGSTPIALAAADASLTDNSGILNLLVANNVSSDVSILVGNGDGTFQTGRFVTASGNPLDLDVADFDRDGCPDFVTSLTRGRISGVFYGDCQNGFTRGPQSLGSPNTPAGLVAHDFTGDGLPDVAVADQVDNSLSVFTKRTGTGQSELRYFLPASSSNTYVLSRRPLGATSGDFDGDGRYDVATANSFVAGSASVLTNIKAAFVLRGDGNSDQRVTAADFVATAREISDLDGDKVEDVARSTYAAASGVDADGDGIITAHDRRAVASWIFPRL